jgi:type I site-specific restriction endonuclease
MPTGTGKTRAFCELAAQLGLPTLVIVHRDELARQALETLSQVWPGADARRFPDPGWEKGRAVVATVQTLARRLGQVPRDRFGLVVVDEAHHAPARTWTRVLDHFAPRFVLGCTATPDRLDGKDLGELFGGEPIYTYGLGAAMRDGVLVPLRQHGIETGVLLDNVRIRGRDYDQKSLSRVVDTEDRNRAAVRAYLEHAAGRPVLVFGVDLDHTDRLREEFLRVGVKAAAVSGKTRPAVRRSVLDDFRGGRLQAVVSCEVLTEGYDERRVSCVVMARPTQSVTLYQQCVGRGLRLDPDNGKVDCVVLDLIDSAAGRWPVTASRLFGARVLDCGGRDVRDAAASYFEKTVRLYPLTPTLAQVKRWQNGTDTVWEELPDLRGYTPTRWWEKGPASDRQLAALKRYGFEVLRPLTKGEASHLIESCVRLDKIYCTPATDGQESTLRKFGWWEEGLCKREAIRRVGHLLKQINRPRSA